MKYSKIYIFFLFALTLQINHTEAQTFSCLHNISITIIPDSSYLSGIDEITINNSAPQLEFRILRSMTISEISTSDYNYKIDSLDNYYNKITLSSKKQIKKNISKAIIQITYKGKIYNLPDEINLTQRHSNSAGIISAKKDEGIYLPSGSFYPALTDELSNYKIQAKIPSEFTLITSGEAKVIVNNNIKEYTFQTKFPMDEITLVGGRYVEKSKVYDGKTFSIYTYDSTSQADTYLDASINYYKLYSNLFGEYPYQTFSIVDNFFATGFGMPGYTLLSGKLLNMPWVTLSPGSLAHEFVHNWWGNSVYTDNEKGNWCEALTTFSANYYYNILTNNENGAIDWRKKALLSINDLPQAKNYPVIKFKYQRDMFDAVIGYDKGSFIFYEIYKLIGKDNFFNALKSFATEFRGKQAYWKDLIDKFSKTYPLVNNKFALNNIINRWLNSDSIPSIKLVSAKKEGNNVSINIHKSNDFVLSLPILYIGDNKSEKLYYVISDENTTINQKLDFDVKKIELDPNYEVLRHLYAWEKPYNFNRTLAEKPVIILPDKNSTDYTVASQLVQNMKESGWDFPVKFANEISENEIRNNSLIILGNGRNNAILKNALKNLPRTIEINEENTRYNDKEMPTKEIIMLSNQDHPSNSDKLCTIIYFDGLKNIEPLKRLFHYQSYSLVILGINKTGRPLFNMEIFPIVANKNELQSEFK